MVKPAILLLVVVGVVLVSLAVLIPTVILPLTKEANEKQQEAASAAAATTASAGGGTRAGTPDANPELGEPPEYPWTKFKDVSEYPLEESDLPFLWNIPRGGYTALFDTMKHCYGLTPVSDLGYETHKVDGLQQVRADDALSLPEVGFFSSPHLRESALILPDRRGRMIASFRHPHHRELNEFRFKKAQNLEPYRDMTFMDFLQSDLSSDNWLTRFIANKHTGRLTEEDFDLAIRIIRRKCLVLMIDEDSEESIRHVEDYFGWSAQLGKESCKEKMLELHQADEDEEVLDPNLPEWSEVNRMNQWDIKLYLFVRNSLFVTQGNELAMDPKFGQK